MVKSLARDVGLAALAAFLGALGGFQVAGGVSLPAVKALLLAAAYAALRAAAGAAILKFTTWRSV